MTLKASSLRMLLVLALLTLLAASGFAVVLESPSAAAYTAITAEFDHPSFAGINETVPCTLTLSGGPAGDIGGNFSYDIEADGENTNGFSASPQIASSETGVFKLNLTMPVEAGQTIVVVISVTSLDYRSRDSVNQTFEYDIRIVDPIVISAEVFNTGTVDAVNVTANFFADGDLLGTRVFSIAAGDSKVLEYNWTFSSIKDGKHVVTVSIDEDNDIVEFSNGNNVFSRTIYVGDQSNLIGGVLMFAVVFLGVIVTLTYFQKPAKKKKF